MTLSTITASRRDLVAALNRAARIISRRSTIPILGCLRLAVHDERLSVRACNLDLEIETICPVSGGWSSGPTLLPAARLRAFLLALSCPRVSLTHHGDTVAISDAEGGWDAPTLRMRIWAAKDEDFPRISHGDAVVSTTFADGQMHGLFSPVAFAMSTEETRYYLNGICLDHIGGDLVAVATNGHVLAHKAMPCPVATRYTRAILPRIAVPALLALPQDAEILMEGLGPREPIEPGTTRFADGGTVPQRVISDLHAVAFTAPGIRIVSKVVVGTFPDWWRVVPRREGTNEITVDRDKLWRAYRQTWPVISGTSHAATALSAIAPDNGGRGPCLQIEGGNLIEADGAEIVARVPSDFRGAPWRVGVSGAYLGLMLRALPSGDLRIGVDDKVTEAPGTPITIRSETDPSLGMVLMPLRI